MLTDVEENQTNFVNNDGKNNPPQAATATANTYIKLCSTATTKKHGFKSSRED